MVIIKASEKGHLHHTFLALSQEASSREEDSTLIFVFSSLLAIFSLLECAALEPV
jgi:hypothetical protein